MEASAKGAGKVPALNPWSALVLLAAGAVILTAVAVYAFLRPGSPAALEPGATRALYLEFGATADTLWQAQPERPDARRRLFTVQHAVGFGIAAVLSPDGHSLAYSLLSKDTVAPGPDSPADLYVATLPQGSPRLLAHRIDLLVRPLWTPDGKHVVVRRSEGGDPASFRLVQIEASSGQERPLVASSEALFPVGYTRAEGAFYFVQVAPGASELRVIGPSGTDLKAAARLADDLTREWTLSPDGSRLAYLSLSVSTDRVASHAMLLDLGNGQITSATDVSADQFGLAWSPRGALSLGQLTANGTGAAAALTNGQPTLPGPATGFDVPTAWSADGRYLALRTFEGTSTVAPGRSVLTVVGPNGLRKVLVSQEATFVGWLNP